MGVCDGYDYGLNVYVGELVYVFVVGSVGWIL